MAFNILGQLMPVVLAAEINGPLRGPRERQPLRAVPTSEDAAVGHVVAVRRSAQVARGDLLKLALRIEPSRPDSIGYARGWSWLPPLHSSSRAHACSCRPQMTSA